MGQFSETNPRTGDREIAWHEVILFTLGLTLIVACIALDAYLLWINKWPQPFIIIGTVIATVVCNIMLPGTFPAHPLYQHAQKLLSQSRLDMSHYQFAVALITAGVYNFMLRQAITEVRRYEGLNPNDVITFTNLILIGTHIVPGYMVMKIPDWWARRAHRVAQEVAYADQKLLAYKNETNARAAFITALTDMIGNPHMDVRLRGMAMMMLMQFLSGVAPGDNSGMTTRQLTGDVKALLSDFMDQDPGK